MREHNSTFGSAGFNGRMLFRQEFIFWTAAALLLFLFLWTAGVTGYEADFAETAREMACTGEWLQPMLNWQCLPGQSAPGYWLPAFFIKLFGRSEMAVRIPGALAALGALYALRILGRILFNEKSAAVSCWLFLGSSGFLLWGRAASADMFSTLIVLMAVSWFLENEKIRSFTGYLLFYFLLFGSTLFKGESALILPLLILLTCLLGGEGWKIHLNRNNFLAFIAGAFVYLGYLYIAFRFQDPEAGGFAGALRCEALRRISQLFMLKETWYNCWITLLIYLLPWAPFLPVGLWGFLQKDQAFSQRNRRLFGAICLTFILLAIFNADSPESILPLIPFVLLFSAAGFAGRGVERRNALTFTIGYGLCIGAASLYICSIIAYPLWDKIADCTPPAVLVLGPVIAGALAWFTLFMDHAPNSSVSRIFGLPHKIGSFLFAGTILSGCILSVGMPTVFREFDTGKQFFRGFFRETLRSVALHEGRKTFPVVYFDLDVPSGYLFYNDLASPVQKIDDLEQLLRQYPGEKVVLFMKKRDALLEKLNSQCSRHGLRLEGTFFSEEQNRWKGPESRNDKFVSFIIDVPGRKGRSGDNS